MIDACDDPLVQQQALSLHQSHFDQSPEQLSHLIRQTNITVTRDDELISAYMYILIMTVAI